MTRNQLLVEINLFDELPWTRREIGFNTILGRVGISACHVHITFDHPGMVPVVVHIVRAPADLGWTDKRAERMRRVHRAGVRMWKYVNLLANRMIKWRYTMEKHIVMHMASHLNPDTVNYLIGFL